MSRFLRCERKLGGVALLQGMQEEAVPWGDPSRKGRHQTGWVFLFLFFFALAFSEFGKFLSEAEQESSILPVCSGVNWFLFEIFTGWEHQ